MIIVSLASYDKRLSYLQKTIHSILNQTLKFDKLIINIPDDTYGEVYQQFLKLCDLDSRINVQSRPHKWRSANKLLWTAKERPEDVILTCDDDIFYPKHFFQAQYDVWLKHQDCIVAQEISPVFIKDGKVQHLAAVDVKLFQKNYGRYLTGCCLFPPHVLDGTEAYDWDKFYHVTHATHDELWFWCMTTLKGIKSIGMNCTLSFDSDETVLPRDENSLSFINSDVYLTDYNQRINEMFGEKLVKVLSEQTCEFDVNKDNLLAICGNAQQIKQIYGGYHIKMTCDYTIQKSHLKKLASSLNQFKWEKGLELKINEQN